MTICFFICEEYKKITEDPLFLPTQFFTFANFFVQLFNSQSGSIILGMKEFDQYNKLKGDDKQVKSLGDLLPDILDVIQIYLKQVKSQDFVKSANQKDTASILATALDLLKFALTQGTPKEEDIEKILDDFRKRVLNEK